MTMSATELDRALRALRLSGMSATLQARALAVASHEMDFIEAFSWLVQDELDRRRSRLVATGIPGVRSSEEPQPSLPRNPERTPPGARAGAGQVEGVDSAFVDQVEDMALAAPQLCRHLPDLHRGPAGEVQSRKPGCDLGDGIRRGHGESA